jgi:hypothetical protein
VGDALVSIGDRLLAGFPGLRDRFRAAIRERVARAEAAVNRLAGALKEGVQRALNLLGSALNGALGLLERGMLAAVDAANRAVQGAIQFGRSVVQGFAAFAALIRDVAANPGQWIRNLGAAVVDGIRNHLWAALKTAIKEWFNSKVEEVLGLGMAVWQLLSRGGIAMAQVGRMVWEGLKQVIPITLIQILIQRLVSMIVPAVGAVMVIIETLQAAWGTVSRIIQAFERFFAFLRAVKSGNAGPQFAQALAAAAVAVIDFVSNFLLMRLRRPAGALAGRIRAIAQRIGQRLRRITQGIARRARQLGRRIRGGVRGLRSRFQRRRGPQRRTDRRRRETPQQRLDRAVGELRPRIEGLFKRGVSGIVLFARLQLWRLQYRLSALSIRRESGGRVKVIARVNPWRETGDGLMPSGEELRVLVHEAAERVLEHPDVIRLAEAMSRQRDLTAGPVTIPGGVGFPAAVRHFREAGRPVPRFGTVHRYELGEDRIAVTEQRRFGGRFGRWVRGIGRYSPTGPNQDLIPNQIARIRSSTRMTDTQVAIAVRDFVRTGQLPPQLRPHAGDVGALAFLMFGRESARNVGNVAFGPMTLSLVAEGRMSFQEATRGTELARGGGGAFPMSMRGAERAARELEEERAATRRAEEEGLEPPPQNRSREARELARREISLAERWLRHQMQMARLHGFDTQDDARDFVYERILNFYKLRMTAGVS